MKADGTLTPADWLDAARVWSDGEWWCYHDLKELRRYAKDWQRAFGNREYADSDERCIKWLIFDIGLLMLAGEEV